MFFLQNKATQKTLRRPNFGSRPARWEPLPYSNETVTDVTILVMEMPC